MKDHNNKEAAKKTSDQRQTFCGIKKTNNAIPTYRRQTKKVKCYNANQKGPLIGEKRH